MLSIIRRDSRITIKLTGRLEGASAEDLRILACPPSALDIDLSGVTSIDSGGERALVWLQERGATLHGEGPFARSLCRRLRIEQLT
jgi:anti-anti-sigma regulatory factor